MEIILDHVYKKIGKNIVVDDVSFNVHSGSVVGLKGINGSGKTMIMRLIAGLIYATSGTVSIDSKILGKDITFPSSMGIMLENPSFLNGYNGYDNLKMLASIQAKVGNEQIEEVMTLVGLKESGKKKYSKFSLGMRQRLGIAAAIMEKPDILLLDEPTNSLDESGVEMVKDIICSEKARGAAVVLSCHDSKLLDSLSDEIIYLSYGKIKDIYTPIHMLEEII